MSTRQLEAAASGKGGQLWIVLGRLAAVLLCSLVFFFVTFVFLGAFGDYPEDKALSTAFFFFGLPSLLIHYLTAKRWGSTTILAAVFSCSFFGFIFALTLNEGLDWPHRLSFFISMTAGIIALLVGFSAARKWGGGRIIAATLSFLGFFLLMVINKDKVFHLQKEASILAAWFMGTGALLASFWAARKWGNAPPIFALVASATTVILAEKSFELIMIQAACADFYSSRLALHHLYWDFYLSLPFVYLFFFAVVRLVSTGVRKRAWVGVLCVGGLGSITLAAIGCVATARVCQPGGQQQVQPKLPGEVERDEDIGSFRRSTHGPKRRPGLPLRRDRLMTIPHGTLTNRCENEVRLSCELHLETAWERRQQRKDC